MESKLDRITGKEIRKQLKTVWPDIYSLNTDKEFIVPNDSEVKDLIVERSAAEIRVLDDIAECDDISIILWGHIKEARAVLAAENKITVQDQMSWPFGICFGLKFNGRKMYHWQNLCFTQQGILMIEPQLNRFWIGSFTNDDVRFALI